MGINGMVAEVFEKIGGSHRFEADDEALEDPKPKEDVGGYHILL
jgi:hypothetical protein